MNVERLGMARSPTRKQPASLWDSEHSRGYVWWSDRCFSSQYLSQEKRGRDCHEEEDRAHRGYHETWTDAANTCWFDARDSPTNLYAGPESTECRRGHPLGWGRPEEVPQVFRDTFHSAQEEQSDSAPEYVLEDSGEESDDIVVYDMETSCYMMVADRDRWEKRDRCRANHRHWKEWCHDPVITKRSWISLFYGIPHLTMP